MHGIGWKHRIARKVMVELLYAEGIRWAGWYRDGNLVAKWDEIMGAYMRNPLRLGRARRWTPKAKTSGKATIDWSELDRWLAEA